MAERVGSNDADWVGGLDPGVAVDAPLKGPGGFVFGRPVMTTPPPVTKGHYILQLTVRSCAAGDVRKAQCEQVLMGGDVGG